jgi:Icc-related predicted phosphoesterase
MKALRAVLLLALATSTCLEPSEDRAERDLEIGKATIPALTVDVAEGHAAIRALEPGQLTLWGSVPRFDVDLNRSSAVSKFWTLEVWNALPDTQLSSNTELEISELPTDVATRKRWSLSVPEGRTRISVGPPMATQRAAFRFALMSDVQEAIDDVSDVYDRINAEPDVRFLLGAGDLTERGTRAELERFESELLRLKIPYFTTLGNHELGTTPSLYQEFFGRANYHFQFQGVSFTLLDSASATLDLQVYTWLDAWLAKAKNSVHVVAMHIPPLDPSGVRNGAFASRAEAAKLLGRLAEARVDLTLYGHVHSYYAFDNAGIPAFISGGGGAIPERFDRIGRHFLVIDTDPDRGVLGTRMVRVD